MKIISTLKIGLNSLCPWFLGATLLWLFLRAAFDFHPHFDFTLYHLPMALRFFDLTTFTPGPRISMVLDGFPVLANFVQGFLVWATGGHLASAQLTGFLGLGAFVFISQWLAPVNLKLWLTVLLSIPLVVLHLHTGFIDLWSGAWLALSFVALFACIEKKFDGIGKPFLILVLSLWVATWSKMQSWPVAGFIIAVYFILGIREKKEQFVKIGTQTVFLALLATSWAIRNFILFENPTYPIPTPGITVQQPGFDREELERNFAGSMPGYLVMAPPPVRFWVSALELGRFKNPEVIWRIDMWQSGTTSNPNHRMGGWFCLTVLALIILLYKSFRMRAKSRVNIAIFGMAVILVSFIPQSHELRYWLFVPLTASYLAVRYLSECDFKKQEAMRALFTFLMLISVFGTSTFKWEFRSPEDTAPSEAKKFWASSPEGENCVPQGTRLNQGIYWAGPDFNQFKVKVCE